MRVPPSLIVQAAGIITLCVGVSLFSLPGGIITLGVLVIVTGIALERSGR